MLRYSLFVDENGWWTAKIIDEKNRPYYYQISLKGKYALQWLESESVAYCILNGIG